MASKSLDFQIIMDASAVVDLFETGSASLVAYERSWIVKAAEMTKQEMRNNAPEGVAGVNGQGLKNHIGVTYGEGALTASVGPDSSIDYAAAVETGSKPHVPPSGPDSSLAQWAEMKGIDVHSLAWHIAHYGTKAHPYVAPTFKAIQEPITAIFNQGVSEYITRLGI